MPLSHDTILLETVRTRRARLRSALVHGGPAERRVLTENLTRFVGSLVLAAVACAGCVGFAVVAGILAARGPAGAPAPAYPSATVSSGPSTQDRR
jgi:hypothetical protein